MTKRGCNEKVRENKKLKTTKRDEGIEKKRDDNEKDREIRNKRNKRDTKRKKRGRKNEKKLQCILKTNLFHISDPMPAADGIKTACATSQQEWDAVLHRG